MLIKYKFQLERALLDKLRKHYFECFGSFWLDKDEFIGQVPGKTEIIGNHVDHLGRMRICSNSDKLVSCYVVTNNTDTFNTNMDDFGKCSVDINNSKKREEEEGTSTATIRSIFTKLAEHNFCSLGFDAVIFFGISTGVSVSPSSVFKVVAGAVLLRTTKRDIDDYVQPCLILFQVSTGLEYEYYGKVCGKQDQLACTYDSILGFKHSPEVPVIKSYYLTFRDSLSKYKFLLIDSKTVHCNCGDGYVVVPQDIFNVAELLVNKYLIDVGVDTFYAERDWVMDELSEYLTLRAEHFFRWWSGWEIPCFHYAIASSIILTNICMSLGSLEQEK
ncbi:MAG: hypothetical protein HUJ51_03865 [Eggerthellaceae bacterium]|nr:hypothetical protein [Eggerthellaceae bacterium]